MTPPMLETVNQAIGVDLPRASYRYSARDAVLYALGIGAPADPLDQDELKFVYELSSRGYQVFPTFAVIFTRDLNQLFMSGEVAGIRYNPMMLVHGEQHLEILKPLPAAANVQSTLKIADIQDKGSGMLLHIDGESFDENGDGLALARWSVFIRGLGGYGGERGSGAKIATPDRAPDIVHEEKTRPNQALLYRLAGDHNPLHADPDMAAIGHYEKPILHGLCTYGFAARAILKHAGDNQADRLRSLSVRFSQHVFPGETLRTEIWRDSPGELRFRTLAKERNAVVLSQARATLRE